MLLGANGRTSIERFLRASQALRLPGTRTKRHRPVSTHHWVVEPSYGAWTAQHIVISFEEPGKADRNWDTIRPA